MYTPDGKDGRLTIDELETFRNAANVLVFDGGKRDEMLRVLFNLCIRESEVAGIDPLEFLEELYEELECRLKSPLAWRFRKEDK